MGTATGKRNPKLHLLLICFLVVLSVSGLHKVAGADEVAVQEQFKVRGFHIDLRIQVLTMDALKSFTRELSEMGINTLLIEWEATYPFDKHATISNRYAYTRREVEGYLSYCAGLGIDVIPLQQCFAHIEYILRHDRYGELREDEQDISQLCPLKKEEARKLFSEIFADIAATHPSEYIHIGGDETWLLGHCENCAAFVEQYGKSRLYVDYMKMMCEIVIGLGKRPVLWADIILENPEAVSLMPEEAIFIDWNYGWAINNFGNIEPLLKQGLEFWGSPAIRSYPDNYFLSCWEKHFNNIRDFIPYARNAGYTGMIMTSWSTSGIFGYEWVGGREVVDMFAIRHVYPLSGFRILVAAYAQALKQAEPVQPESFVTAYAGERFGFNEADAQKFWEALSADPSVVATGKPGYGELAGKTLGSVSRAKKILSSLQPHSNQQEFEHFRLMFDIREHYLRFKVIEAKVQSPGFDRSQVAGVARGLEKLLEEAPGLDRRFLELNRGFLYESELKSENANRNRKMKLLYERLTGKR